MPSPTVVVLRTAPENIPKVIEHKIHALNGRLVRAKPGDLLLIAERQRVGPAIAKYGMLLQEVRPDVSQKSKEIWGKQWKYIIEGRDLVALAMPFSPHEIAPLSGYGAGGPFVYISPDDAEEFRRRGLLAPFL
jgi:hypothetical protein